MEDKKMITTTNNSTTTTKTIDKEQCKNEIIAKIKQAVEQNYPCVLLTDKYKRIRTNLYKYVGKAKTPGTTVKITEWFLTARLDNGTLKKSKQFIIYVKQGNEFLTDDDLFYLHLITKH